MIDYIIMTKTTIPKVKDLRVDKEGTHRMKGREETDHNTILMEIDTTVTSHANKITVWKRGSKSDWRNFNEAINRDLKQNPTKTYMDLEQAIKRNLIKHIGKVTIRTNRNRDSKEAKNLREKKKQAGKEFDQAIKSNNPRIAEIKNNYIQAQKDLRNQIEKDAENKSKNIIQTLIKEGGAKSNLFWKLRRKIIKKDSDANYDTKDETGKTITNPEEAKEHIAKYYENLYQAREGTAEFQQWTEKIRNKIEEIEKEMQNLEPVPEITQKELKLAIKNMKRGKSCGPDEIPNEVFIEAQEPLLKEVTKHLNDISTSENIPDSWQEGEIKRLYKGKGNKGKCSAERGITLASNMGKLYERIINNRILHEINISDAQAGGKKGRATTDHLLVVKELINIAKKKRKPLYIVFLDVTKAYDKAWLDAIMYVMHKEGLQSKHWSLVRKLNQNLSAKIKTKYGLTREIRIKDSIRQGGVLSVAQYAILMDEIHKELNAKGMGIKLTKSDTKVGDLLWVDDVALMSFDENELQDMLDITYHTAKKYRIEFGKEKSQILVIGTEKQREKTEERIFKLGDMSLDRTQTYNYLGETINEKGDISDHTKKIRGKVEAAFQTIQLIAGDDNFNKLEMETIWKLVETCIIPIATYASETWNNNKTNTQEINRILDSIIKRILKTPVSTPRETLYMETGLMDLEHEAKRKQILMRHRLSRTTNPLIQSTIDDDSKGGWKERTDNLMKELEISKESLQLKKEPFSKLVKKSIDKLFKNAIDKKGEAKSKVEHLKDGTGGWIPMERRKYMSELSRNQVSKIFQARTRMLNIKNNYRNNHKNDLGCRACGQPNETQPHVLRECTVLHASDNSEILQTDIFTENPRDLRKTAKKLESLLEDLTADPRTERVDALAN